MLTNACRASSRGALTTALLVLVPWSCQVQRRRRGRVKYTLQENRRQVASSMTSPNGSANITVKVQRLNKICDGNPAQTEIT